MNNSRFAVLWAVLFGFPRGASEHRRLRATGRGRGFLLLCGLLALLAASGSIRAASLPSGFTEISITDTWDDFCGVTFDEVGAVYAWDRKGRVWIIENDTKLPTPLLDISEEVGAWDDYGLLGVAFHPNFRSNGYIYLLYVVDHHYLKYFGTPSYNPTANDYHTATIGRITRYTARASDNFHSVDPASRLVLVGETASTGFPIMFYTHGVGTLTFGTDGSLLASCGDGGGLSDGGSDSTSYYAQALTEGIIRPKENIGAFRAQMVDSMNGKIMRLDPATGNGLPSNPFYDAAKPRSARSRVYALGLRNPYRITLRPGTGSHLQSDGFPGVIYAGDVGYFTWEELSVVTAPGQNCGWPIFEGYTPPASYADMNPANQDAPNPLFGVGGCTQQYFTFRDLIKEASLSPPSWPNPCDPSQQIPSSIPRFVHRRPAADWQHGTGPSRVGTFSGGVASTANIGAGGAPVSGPQFGGNCSIGGTWYTGTAFPAQYRNSYFQGDLGNTWIKCFSFDSSNTLYAVQDFANNAGAVVCVAAHPTNGALYYIAWTDALRKITYVGAGNQPPTAVASANLNYGPGPLAVQFTGANSFDPEGQALTYRWNFGDGSAISTAANPSHTFTAPAGVPTRYNVTLTVTDTTSATNSTTLIISVNNTPPNVTILSPVNGSFYSVATQTVVNLSASVTDAEHTQAQLSPQWQVVLHHNNHVHTDPIDTNWTTSATLAPLGCDGDTYFYRITLSVTDAAGLTGSAYVDLFPNCSSNTPPTISDLPNQSVVQGGVAGPLAFTVTDAETLAANLNLSGVSSNPTLAPNANIVFGGSGSSRTVTVTPAAGQSGTATITITVSDGSLSASDSFVLTVSPPSNTAPTISDIANQTIAEDATTGALGFTVSDAESAASSLTVTGSSSNPTLVPNANLVFGGSGALRNLTVTPAPNQSGTATLTVTVSDGLLTSSDSFVLTVTAVNDPPTISNVADQTLNQDTGTGPLAFTVGDLETAAASLTVSGTSSNPTLVPNANIVFGGSGANRTVTVTPAAGQTGTATITVTVSDGALTANDTFVLTVNAVTAPTYLLTEGFEGTGFENTGWIKHGSANPDYTNVVLVGAQSLNCVGAQYLERPFAYGNSFYLYFQARWNTWKNNNNIIYWDDSNYNIVAGLYADRSRAEIVHGTASMYGTTTLSANVTYHFWVEWTKGTGANGTMKLFISTTGVKPANPESSITTGNGGAPARIYLGPTGTGPNVIFDRLLVDDVPIGSTTGGNQSPTISDIANQTINQGAAAGPLAFTVGDAETAAASLTVSGSSSNPTLVPNANIVFGGSGANRTVTVTPAAGQTGTATITVTVSDGALTASDPFVLTVNATANTAPTISNIADQTVNEDTPTAALAFTVGDAQTAAGSLTVTGSSSNPTLVPNGNIVFGGSGANRTVTVTPAANQSGSATITVTVSDGSLTASDPFVLTVTAVNDAPTISNLADQTITQDGAAGPIAFTVGDVETAAASLTVSGSSSNPTLVPNANIVFGGSGASRTVTVTPAAGQTGTATITVTVSDGALTASDPFVLTVNAAGNTAPTISNIADQTINEDTPTAALAFTVGDAQTAAGSLTVTGSSSNPTLVPNGNIVFGGSGANRTVTVTPAANQSGTATITVTVSDGTLTGSDPFVLTVTAVNDAPTISNIADQTINQDTVAGPIAFTVGDVETAAASLTLTGSSSNPALVPNANIVFGGSGANRTVTVTPAAGQVGTSTITVSVGDGALTATDTFVLTVNSSSAPTYLLMEGFEGTGFENTGWITHGSANPDYTNVVLHGSQSLNCSGAQYVERPFAYTTSFNLYFRVRWNTWGDYNNIIYWDDANYSIVAGIYADDNRIEADHGSAYGYGTTTISANTTYHVWAEWTKGTGNNGTMRIFMSTTGTKPATPEVNLTTGTGGAPARIYIGPTSSGANAIFDRLLVDDVPIGSNP
jgi:hypothetical protein